MALTTMLVVLTLVVALSDGMMGQPNFNFGEFFPKIHYVPAVQLPQLPLPGFPHINLPQPPPLPVISFNNPNQYFRKEPHQNKPYKPYPPYDPTMETIQNHVPSKDGSYNAVYLASSSNSNGQGVAKILVNQNGKTYDETFYFPDNSGKTPQKDPENSP